MDRRNLVSSEWLHAHLEAPDVVVVDASWYLPNQNRDGHAEYLEAHIPGAVFFDIDAISDTSSNLPHMLPPAHVFSSHMRKLGIGDGQTIVVYDGAGLFSAARAWWMFRIMGVARVFVLDGGLPKWRAEKRPLEDGAVSRPDRHFSARLNHAMVRDVDDIRAIVTKGGAQIADARSRPRFDAVEKEPRPGLRSGHIPGSACVHYASLLDSNGCLKASAELEQTFRAAGIDPARPIVTTCGSGVTAAILSLALDEIGARKTSLYDGSWTEWGGLPDTPVATGNSAA
ncbi:3-mercaptopyruvate sulfurtransferase [Breoghania sp. L-A4]|uniref:3-mercaptopyruvate sulfurtransferase n=1 Tax=Breoghania sp. L-A4 TaxID=2304600 RepID=UPI000E3595FF|nr:3-mercaptopyruvate sulfurtransferase [Breoghania sp. L-A4]AXS40918.1 3-mercaptopyruvate sulfurtransferase [Breoghania sp. L-A4]